MPVFRFALLRLLSFVFMFLYRKQLTTKLHSQHTLGTCFVVHDGFLISFVLLDRSVQRV